MKLSRDVLWYAFEAFLRLRHVALEHSKRSPSMGWTNDHKCPKCNGTGDCPSCHGSGCDKCNETRPIAGGWGGTSGDGKCSYCEGTGKTK